MATTENIDHGEETTSSSDSTSDNEKQGSSADYKFMAPVGTCLLAAGGGLIVIDGLGVTVKVADFLIPRLVAVILGAALLIAFFVMRDSLERIETKSLVGLVAVVGALFVILLLFFEDPKVPDMAGLTGDNARNIVTQLGIEVRAEQSIESDQPAGEVVAQNPGGGSRTDDVVFEISRGPATPRMVDVVGLDRTEAESRLEAAGIDVVTIFVTGPTEGLVQDARPATGEDAHTATLLIQDGEDLPEMVDVVGRGEELAQIYLDIAKIQVTKEFRASSVFATGTVMEQQPTAGSPTAVATLVISAGVGAPVVPDLVNSQVEQAVGKLDELAIDVRVVEVASADAPAGTVISQSLDEGDRDDEIVIRVSSGPSEAAFPGMWVNLDPETSGLTRLEIVRVDGGLQVSGFTACTPEDCKLGTDDAVVGDQVLSVTFEFEHRLTRLSIKRAGPLLLVEVTNDYDEGEDVVENFTLSLEFADEITPEDLEILATSTVVGELLESGAAEFVPGLGGIAAAQPATP